MNGLRDRLAALPGNLRGALWAAGAVAMFACMEATIKAMGATMHPLQIAFFRCIFAFLFIAPIVLAAGGFARVATARFGAHLGRTLIGYAAMATGFLAITRLPLADAVALGYVRQLFLVVLAVAFLGETVRWRRWTATAVGFAGVVVMVRPGAGVLDPFAFVALASGFLVACVTVAIKRLAETESAEATVFWFAAIASVVSLGPAVAVWRWPEPWEWGTVAALGVMGAFGQYFAMRAYRVADATAVEPVDYARLILAAIFGVFVFGETIDAYTVLGAAIIVASTLYIMRREARLAASARPR